MPWTLHAVAALAAALALVPVARAAASPAVSPDKAAKALQTIAIANAGFETAKEGTADAPNGWVLVQHTGPLSYSAKLVTDVKRAGERSARVDNIGPEAYGTLGQALIATPWRGKTLRFSAWLRIKDAAGNRFGRGVGIYLNSWRRGAPHVFSQMQEDAVPGTHDWTRYEMVLKVPEDADMIEFGLIQFGPGTAWIDDVALDEIEPLR